MKNQVSNGMRIVFAFLFLMLFVQTESNAQTKSNYSSYYSAFGLGMLEQSRSPQGEALGIFGVAFDQVRSVNLANPAMLSGYAFTTGFGSVEQVGYTATQNNNTVNYSNFLFNGMGVVFPINKGKFAASASLTPLTYMNSTATQESVFPGDTTLVISQINGKGGVNAFELGFGYRLNENFSIGYAPAYVFGTIKNSVITAFEDNSFRTVQNGTNNYYAGLYHNFGVSYHNVGLINKNDRIILGLTFRLPSTLTVDQFEQITLITGQFEQPITTRKGSTETTLPLSLKFGATYYFNPKFLVSSDVAYEKWSDYKSLINEADVSYSDRIRLGLGGMYVPELRSSTGFFASIAFKTGFSYDTGYLNIKDNAISKMAVHAGLTIPSQFIGSSLDFNVEYGILGTQSAALVKEEVLSFKCVINLSEFMFFRRQLQ